MKRSLVALLLAVFTVTTIGAAQAKTKAKPSARKVSAAIQKNGKTQPEVELEALPAASSGKLAQGIKPTRKGFETLGDGDDLVSPPSNGNGKPFGGPVEQRLTRAGSRRFDLRSLPLVPIGKFERPEHEEPSITRSDVNAGGAPPQLSSPAVAPRNAPAPPTNMNFDGLDFANWGAGHPPDTVGDVGPNYYIQSINSSIGVFRKSDGVRVAAFTLNTFMNQGAFGNLCDTNNFGDPVILYDTFEDRWIITDFAFQLSGSNVVNPPGAFQCFAASMTGDPVSGGWNFYSINTQFGLGDYPKFGIWPDGLYMTASIFGFPSGAPFQNARAYAFNKQQMYAGAPSVQVVSFDILGGDFTVLPSNARLQSGTPPPGTPNYYLGTWIWLDGPTVYKFHVDWNNISTSTFTGPDLPKATTLWPNANVPNALSLGGNSLDVLQIRAMMQNQYTNIGGVESLWATHTVRRGDTSGLAAPRWYQVTVTGGNVNLSIPQATTWDPDGANVISRFMPSLAVDRVGNMALGYSTSSSSTKPAIKYAGRLFNDPINTFSQTEQLMIQGAGTQVGNCGSSACIRWGDYSAMSLDPDGCTFWYTNMYYAVDGLNHQTRIASFGPFPGCVPVGAGGTLSGTVTATNGGAPIGGATVQFGSRTATTNGSGVYSFFVPAGTYPKVTASKGGFIPASASPIAVTDSNTTTQNFSLADAPTSACIVDTTQPDWQSGTPSGVDLVTSAGSAVLSNGDPQNSIISTSGGGITSTTWGGQTFTPLGTGQVTKIDINLFCSVCSGTPQNLTVGIRATSGGFPTGADLGTATINGFLAGNQLYYSAIFATPVPLTGGTMYAFVIHPNVNPTGTYALSRSGADVYPGGTRVSGSSSGTVWSNPLTATQTTDAGFRVWMGEFLTAGNLVSSVKDASPAGGITPTWGNFTWNATMPANTNVKFQVAASNSSSGPFSFVGPDGTAATFFTANPFSLSQFYNLRYLEYKALLSTTDNNVTPSLNDVSVCFADLDCSGTPSITAAASTCANSTGNTASGPAGETSYAWSITNGTIVGSSASQSVTYTAGASGTVGLFLNVVEPGGCHKSASASVTINPLPPTPTISGTLTFCTGGNTTLTSDSASGNQWYLGGNLIAGETNQNLIVTAAGSYTVQVTDGNGCASAMSAPAVVTANNPPPVPTIAGTTNGTGTQDQACPEQPLTLTATSAGATSYQWYSNNDTLNGETSATYQATGAATYYVTATVNGCTSAQSAGYVVQNPTPHSPFISFRGQDSSVTTLNICQGSSQIIDSDSATGIQWYKDGIAIAVNGNSQSYTATGLAPGTYVFTAQLNALGCHSQFGRNVTLIVDAMPPTPTISGDTNGTGTQDQACPEQPLTLHANGATGAVSYTWYSDNAVIPNESTSTLIMTGVGNISVTATNGTCTTAHSATYVVQNPTPHAPFITIRGQASTLTSITFCQGGSIILDSDSATGIQWWKDGAPIAGPQSQSRSITGLAPGTYTYTAQLNALGCHSQFGRNITVTVNPLPATPTATPGGPTTFCAGGSVTLTSSSASGNQWFLNGSPIGGATNQTYPATASGSYTVTVTDGNACTSAASNTVSVTVNPLPATPTITPGGPTTFCAGGSVTLTSNSASGNQWFLNGNPIGGATNQTYPATASGNYTVKVTDGNSCTSAASSATTVTVNPNPNATITAPASVTTSSTGNAASTANAGVGATYAWSVTGGTLTGGNNTPNITFTAGATPGTLTINLTVTTSAGCSDTKSANVNRVLPVVTVTSVSPNFGTVTGGTIVTINGTNFVAGATVTFGGAAATNVVVVSAIKITAKTPVHAAGSVNVTVTNTDTSTGTLASGYNYQPQVFDPNNDGTLDPADIFYLINYLFMGGPAPHGPAGVLSGDANGDGVVDPADIFYLVNYLFLGGQKPNLPSPEGTTHATAAGSAAPQIAGSISLGKPALRAGRYIVPVIMTSRGSVAPQAMSLRVRLEGDAAIGDVTVRRAGAAKDVPAVFENSQRSGNDVSYLVAYDPRGLALGASRSAVVAEIEIASAEAGLSITIDPELTMLSNQAGTMKATVGNRNLEVSGTAIGGGALPRPHAPGHEVN